MTETTSTIQYFTSSDQSFSSGWYFVENGVRQSAADTGSSLSEANKIILGAGTPTGDTAPVTGGGGNDVFVVQSDTPSLLVIEDLIGDNTLLFSTGVTILSVSSVEAFGAKQAIIRFDTGDGVTKSIQVKALNNISFEFEAGPVAGRGFSFDELEAYINGAPAFSEKGYSVNLAEDASSGDGVITIVADDVTTGDALTYSISDGNADGLFAIDSNTGAITLAGEVDFEAGPTEYVLTVQVSDGNGGTDTVLVTVTVTNVDEGDASFTVTSDGDIAAPQVGDVLSVAVDAADPDGNGDGNISYEWYQINSVGDKVNIPGATGTSYTLKDTDIGQQIGVRAIYTDAGGQSESVETVASVAPVTAAPVAAAPTLTLVDNGFFADGVTVDPRALGAHFENVVLARYTADDLSDLTLTITFTDINGVEQSTLITSIFRGGDAQPPFLDDFQPLRDDATGEIYLGFAEYSGPYSDRPGALTPTGLPQTFTITASTGSGLSVSKSFTINLVGADDEPSGFGQLDETGAVVSVISTLNAEGSVRHEVTESDVESGTPQVRSGQLIINDVDEGDTYTLSVSYTLNGVAQTATLSLADGETKTLETSIGWIELTLNGKQVDWTYTYKTDTGNLGTEALREIITLVATDSITDSDGNELKEVSVSQSLQFNVQDEPEDEEYVDENNNLITEFSATVNPGTAAVGDVAATIYVRHTGDDTSSDFTSPNIRGIDSDLFSVRKGEDVTVNGFTFRTIEILWKTEIGSRDENVDDAGNNPEEGVYELIVSFDNNDPDTSAVPIPVRLVIDTTEPAPNVVPAFDQDAYAADLSEDTASGSPVITVTATDADTGDTLTYSISDGNDDGLFAIDSNTGVVTLVGAVDFETGPAEYVLTVQVSDGNGGTDTAVVTVTVTNVDEGDASFTVTSDGDIAAPQVGDVLSVAVDAADPDGNGDGNISYEWYQINSVGDKVNIPGATGTSYTLKDTDIDRQIGVRAIYTDAGGQSESVETVASVATVTAVPNVVPVFDQDAYAADLSEDTASGSPVITVTATDADTGDTLTYSISDGNDDGLFAIDSNTGVITLVGAVDFETGPAEYVLTVQVSDGNGGTDTVLVTVTVTNVDEGDPVFTGDLTGAIQDVSEDPDAVLSITGIINNIVDPEGDAVPPGTISIADATASGTALSIKTGTYGTFTFFASPGLGGSAARGGTWTYNLDRDRPETLALKAGEEVTETFTLVYTLGDGTEYRTDITITITGADDPFTFSQPDGYIFTVAEDLAVDGVVGQVQALDYDADTQAVVSYVITAGNDDGFFEVNSDGQIVLKKGLDFETILISANKSYILTVQASDGTNTEDVFVTIKVTDVEEGPAKIQITSSDADLDAYDVGTVLTASLVEEDPDGLVGEAQWRWFYLDTPFASIGTGTTYTVKEEDRGEYIGVARVYEDGKGGKGLGENEVREVFVSIVPRVAITPEENTEESDNTVAAQPDKASIVQTGDGSDIITDGSRNDLIIGGLGDDKIDLGSDPDGFDQDQVIYAIGDQTAEDGGDMITNFTRGRDSFIFKLSANAETNAILDMDDFINYLNGGTADDLSDDQLLVGLNFDLDSEGEIELNGLSFHFADSVFFGGGRVSIPVVTISFADPLDKAAIINVLGGDEATIPNIVNSDGILTDLSYLDDLLGGPDAVGYQVEVV